MVENALHMDVTVAPSVINIRLSGSVTNTLCDAHHP